MENNWEVQNRYNVKYFSNSPRQCNDAIILIDIMIERISALKQNSTHETTGQTHTHMRVTIDNVLQKRQLPWAELKLSCNALHQELNVDIVLGRGQVRGDGAAGVDYSTEVERWRCQHQTLFIQGQDVRSHDEEGQRQSEQEADNLDLCDTPQGAQWPQRNPAHLQDTGQAYVTVIHIVQTRHCGSFPVVVNFHWAELAIFVVRLKNGTIFVVCKRHYVDRMEQGCGEGDADVRGEGSGPSRHIYCGMGGVWRSSRGFIHHGCSKCCCRHNRYCSTTVWPSVVFSCQTRDNYISFLTVFKTEEHFEH